MEVALVTPGTKLGLFLALAMFAVVGGYFLVVPDERPSGLSETGPAGEDQQLAAPPQLISSDQLAEWNQGQSSDGGDRQSDQWSAGNVGHANPGEAGSNPDPFEAAAPVGNDLVITWPVSEYGSPTSPEIPGREVASFDWGSPSTDGQPNSSGSAGPFEVVDGGSSASAPGANEPATIREPVGTETYIVKKGDSFWSIAQAWYGDGTKMDLILAANPNVNPQRLQIGQKLSMPAGRAARANQSASAGQDGGGAPAASPPASAGSPGTHIVREGDTLVRIARLYFKNDSKWEAIYAANRSMIGTDPDKLKLGMKLTIPR